MPAEPEVLGPAAGRDRRLPRAGERLGITSYPLRAPTSFDRSAGGWRQRLTTVRRSAWSTTPASRPLWRPRSPPARPVTSPPDVRLGVDDPHAGDGLAVLGAGQGRCSLGRAEPGWATIR